MGIRKRIRLYTSPTGSINQQQMKYLFLIFALFCASHTNCQTTGDDFYLLAYAGGASSNIEGQNRNGINYGLEAHVILKESERFGFDLGGGLGYTSLSMPGGKMQDVAVHASAGLTDNRYVSAGVRLSYGAVDGLISPSVYAALTYPVNDRLNLFGRGLLAVDIIPSKNTYVAGRAHVGVAYYLNRQ